MRQIKRVGIACSMTEGTLVMPASMIANEKSPWRMQEVM